MVIKTILAYIIVLVLGQFGHIIGQTITFPS
jgi:hypothetical protein